MPTITRTLGSGAAALVTIVTALVAAAPAGAHAERGLSARVLTWDDIFCPDGKDSTICTVEGRVRVTNRRAAGSGRIPICIGIDVLDGRGRSLSVEPPTTGGQAVASLRPGQTRVVTYRTAFRKPLTATRPVVRHVHTHIVAGGRLC